MEELEIASISQAKNGYYQISFELIQGITSYAFLPVRAGRGKQIFLPVLTETILIQVNKVEEFEEAFDVSFVGGVTISNPSKIFHSFQADGKGKGLFYVYAEGEQDLAHGSVEMDNLYKAFSAEHNMAAGGCIFRKKKEKKDAAGNYEFYEEKICTVM
jgi:hypothetical protein